MATLITLAGDTFVDTVGTFIENHTPTGPNASLAVTKWRRDNVGLNHNHVTIQSNGVILSDDPGPTSGAIAPILDKLSGPAWPSDICLEYRLAQVANLGSSGVSFRHSTSSDACYAVYFRGSAWAMVRHNTLVSGDLVTIATADSSALGQELKLGQTDLVRVEAVGSSLSVFLNNVLILHGTDSVLSSGPPGLYFVESGPTTTGFQVSNLVISRIVTPTAVAQVYLRAGEV